MNKTIIDKLIKLIDDYEEAIDSMQWDNEYGDDSDFTSGQIESLEHIIEDLKDLIQGEEGWI